MKSSAALPRNYMIYMKQKDIQDAVRRFKYVQSMHRFVACVEYSTENHYESLEVSPSSYISMFTPEYLIIC